MVKEMGPLGEKHLGSLREKKEPRLKKVRKLGKESKKGTKFQKHKIERG